MATDDIETDLSVNTWEDYLLAILTGLLTVFLIVLVVFAPSYVFYTLGTALDASFPFIFTVGLWLLVLILISRL